MQVKDVQSIIFRGLNVRIAVASGLAEGVKVRSPLI